MPNPKTELAERAAQEILTGEVYYASAGRRAEYRALRDKLDPHVRRMRDKGVSFPDFPPTQSRDRRIDCSCGDKVSHHNRAHHLRTAKHHRGHQKSLVQDQAEPLERSLVQNQGLVQAAKRLDGIRRRRPNLDYALEEIRTGKKAKVAPARRAEIAEVKRLWLEQPRYVPVCL